MITRRLLMLSTLLVVGVLCVTGCDDDDAQFIVDPNGDEPEELMPLALGYEWQGIIYYIGENQDTVAISDAAMQIDGAELIGTDSIYHVASDTALDSTILPEYLINKDSALLGYTADHQGLLLGPYTVAEYPTTPSASFAGYLGFETVVMSTAYPIEVAGGGFTTVHYRSTHPGFHMGESDISQVDRYFDPDVGLVRADVWGLDDQQTERLLFIWDLDTLITDTVSASAK
jgi:hypothetical protein